MKTIALRVTFPPSLSKAFANFSIDQDGSPVFDSNIYFGDGYDEQFRKLKLRAVLDSSPQVRALVQSFELGEIDELPSDINKLYNLRSLTIDSGSVTTLPETIGELQHLTHLDIDTSGLETLPQSIVQLTRLEYLGLRNNVMNEVPDIFDAFPYLEIVTLDNNISRHFPLPYFACKDFEHYMCMEPIAKPSR